MRRKVLLFFVINLAIVAVLLHTMWPLLHLLILRGAEDQISRAELPAPNSELIEGIPQRIPRIIHQTYITSGVPSPVNGTYTDKPVPDVWDGAQHSCKELHPDYEYKFWTDSNSRDFIKAEYPWFLETWDSYPFPIQRADAIRYFALHRFGGVYIDLDDGCQRRLDPLLTYSAWVRKSTPTGIGNDVLGGVPGHPFFQKLSDSLPDYNSNWISPYITIMSSTGPLYASLIWRQYNLQKLSEDERVRILFQDEYMSHSWSFFSHHMGNSWHKWDADTIFWMAKHWKELFLLGTCIVLSVFFGVWWLSGRITGSKSPTLGAQGAMPSIFRRLPFLRRRSKYKEYELLDRDV